MATKTEADFRYHMGRDHQFPGLGRDLKLHGLLTLHDNCHDGRDPKHVALFHHLDPDDPGPIAVVPLMQKVDVDKVRPHA